jgi:ABC-type microcin C transport system duplicated ATPase subunit YejF
MIGFEGVSKQYQGGRLALDDVTLSLPAGGSLGLERPTSGRLTFNGTGHPASRHRLRALRRQIGFVLQDPYDSLNPRMTIGDIVSEPLRVHGLRGGTGTKGNELVAEQLAAVGLAGADLRSCPSRYSGSGRQRIAIARALINAPSC